MTTTAWNKKSSLTLTVAFFDEDDNPVTPSAATYRIDDVRSGKGILGVTNFPSLAPSVDLDITFAQNGIFSTWPDLEWHRVTVEFDYGEGKHGTDEYRYAVKDLPKVDATLR